MKDGLTFALSFVLKSNKSPYAYIGDPLLCLLLVIKMTCDRGLSKQSMVAQSQQHLSRRPFSACFAKNEKLLIVGEIEGILELFSLMIPESPVKLSKIDLYALDVIPT